VITLAELHVYPVKSCRGLAPESARLTAAGLEHDREWMIVTPGGRFVTQREEPRLALVEVQLDGGALRLAAAGSGSVSVPLDLAAAPRSRSRCGATAAGARPGRRRGRVARRAARPPLRLVRFDPAHRRRATPPGPALEALTRFSDGFAVLALSRASLADLNGRLAKPLPMDRFRPNLVLDGLPPYGEDACTTSWPAPCGCGA